MKTLHEWRRTLALATVILMEYADYPMMLRMLGNVNEGQPSDGR
jgi:hypothetical protein